MINLFQNNPDDFQYILDSIGQTVLVNNQPMQAVITNTPVNQTSTAIDYDDKKISTLSPIKCGDLVHYCDQDWLLISEINGLRYGKYKAIMRVCDYSIKFNFQGVVRKFPTIVDGRVFNVETDRYMTLPASQILVTLQENKETLRISAGQRFIKLGTAWKVEAIDRTVKGLMKLWCKQDQINSAVDDVKNEIADDKNYVYTLEIANTDSRIQTNDTIQLNVNIMLNGQLVTDRHITFISSASDIATVDENGLITGIRVGTATITARLSEHPDVQDLITVSVESISVFDNYVLAISGDDDIKIGGSKTWKVTLTKNGQPVGTSFCKWSVTDMKGDPSSIITITDQANESVTLKAANQLGHVVLKCKTGIYTAEKKIRVRSLI